MCIQKLLLALVRHQSETEATACEARITADWSGNFLSRNVPQVPLKSSLCDRKPARRFAPTIEPISVNINQATGAANPED
jgi:hypothetical protein